MKSLTLNQQKSKHTSLKLVKRIKIDKIAIQLNNGIKIINIESILYCKAESNYTFIYMDGLEKICISKTLKHMNSVLPDHFLRIHQSYIANLNKVKGLKEKLELSDGSLIPISRSYKQITNEKIKKYFTFI